MKQKIRKSIIQDAEHFVRIKQSLPLPKENNTNHGGFLLGTDIETYKFYIENGYCLTGTVDDKVVGFEIILPNPLVKQSELWEKRKKAAWSIDINELENKNVAYVEQLAFLPGHRRLALKLSYRIGKWTFDNGADYIMTTTVRKPVLNTAALSYINGVGGHKVGNIDEVYPEIGAINSDIYLIKREDFYKVTRKLSLYDFLESERL